MDEHEENFKDIFRYTDVEYTPDGYTDVYRWDDFLVIAGDHVYSAMDTIDSVSPGGEYEGFDPQYAYTCEIVGCGDLFDGCALFRPVSHDGEDYIQIAFLRSDIDDSTGEYTERFEAGSFDMPAADALRFDLAVDLMDYFSGRTFEGEPGVSRGLEPREAVAAVEGATGCDLNFFEDFWLGSPGEIVESVHVGPYTKQSFRRHARTHVGARRGRRREGVDLRLRLLLVRDRRTRFQPRAGALPRRDRGRLGCRAERESI